MERIYPAYLAKVQKNTDLVKDNPKTLGQLLNAEYLKALNSKSKKYTNLRKLPVRIFGSGDYIPEMFEMFKTFDFKFFIISKTLTEPQMRPELEKILALRNCSSVVLSFDTHNSKNWHLNTDLWKKPKIKFSFTGTHLDMEMQKLANKTYTIFFNTGNKKVDKQASKAFKERCPADTGEMKLQEACTKCHKCWI